VALLANAAECCAPHARLTTAFAPWRGARLFALLLLKHKRVPAVRARLRCIVNALPASANLTLARLLGARLVAFFFSKKNFALLLLKHKRVPAVRARLRCTANALPASAKLYTLARLLGAS